LLVYCLDTALFSIRHFYIKIDLKVLDLILYKLQVIQVLFRFLLKFSLVVSCNHVGVFVKPLRLIFLPERA